MKKLVLFLTLLLGFSLFSFSQCNDWIWGKSYSVSNPQDIVYNDIEVDASGNMVIGGNGFVTKLNPAGQTIWTQTFNGVVSNLDVDASGNVIIVGYFENANMTIGNLTLQLDYGHTMYIVKLSSSGSVLWGFSQGYCGEDELKDVVTDPSGNIYVTGYFSSCSVDFGSVVIYSYGGGPYSYILKLNSNGTAVWGKGIDFGSSCLVLTNSIARDIYGNLYVCGKTSITSNSKTIYAKFNTNGSLLFKKMLANSATSEATKIILDKQNNPVMAGYFKSSTLVLGNDTLVNKGNKDIFLSKLDKNGNFLKSIGIGTSGDEEILDLECDSSSNIVFSGYFKNPYISINQDSLFGGNYKNAMIGLLTPDLIPVWLEGPSSSNESVIGGIGFNKYWELFTIGHYKSNSIIFDDLLLNDTSTNKIFISKEINTLKYKVSQTNNKCYGDNKGKISILVNAYYNPVSFAWSTNETTSFIDSLTAATYYVTMTDQNNCSITDSFDITQSKKIILNPMITPTCFNAQEGKISLQITGGSAPYSIKWEDNSSNITIDQKPEGNYPVIVEDYYNCSIKDTFEIPALSPDLSLRIDKSDISCNGFKNGWAHAVVSGGALPYEYQWSNQATLEFMDSLENGKYILELKDSNGCKLADSVEILEPQTLVANIDKQNVRCFGNIDGSIHINVTGGNTPYLVSWGNDIYTFDLDSIPAGTYKFTIIDSNACIVSDSVNITQPEPLVSNALVNNISCFGFQNGQIDLYSNGGTKPYQYSWSNGKTSESIDSLTAGDYKINITDSNNCQLEETFTIEEPEELEVEIEKTNILCYGDQNGEINVNVSGGTKPYGIIWDNLDSSFYLNNLDKGEYNYLVADANNCYLTNKVEIEQPAQIQIEIETFPDTNYTGKGIAVANVSGGVSPYQYLWNDQMMQNTAIASNLNPGEYTLSVTDSNLCYMEKEVTIGNYNHIYENRNDLNLKVFYKDQTIFVISDINIEDINLYNISGQLIFQDKSINALKYSVKNKGFVNGVYLLNVKLADQTEIYNSTVKLTVSDF